jgi:predicted  nucleic acid-binding Zn-ribbon protein
VAKSPAEQFRDLALELRGVTEREAALRDHIGDLRQRDGKHENEIRELRKENADLRLAVAEARAAAQTEIATLRQQLQGLLAQFQEAERRRWSMVVAFLGALLALASGLIVALARK